MSGNIAVIYAGDLGAVTEVFGEAAMHLAAHVRHLQLRARGASVVVSGLTELLERP